MSDARLKTGFRWPAILGLGGLVALFGGFVIWASLTEIAGAVIAQGVVEVSGKPKSVQHFDGGVVERILVADGQEVAQGEELIRLDDTLLSANLTIYRTRLSEALATRDRLIAEQRGAEQIDFSDLPEIIEGVEYDLHRAGQTEIFVARRELEMGRREQLAEKILQFDNQIIGVNALIDAKQQQLEVLEPELAAMVKLAEDGLARTAQLSALKRSQADLLGQIAEHRAELARIQNSIRDTELEVLQGQRQTKEEVVTELRDVTTSIHELTQQIMSTQRQLERIVIRAPNAGRIHEMQITTLGGVVAPGATILQIIPTDLGVTFPIRIDPASIDQIYVGQVAKLRFPAFNARTTPELIGEVVDISPTSVLDEMTGFHYFRVMIAVEDAELARLGERELVPGMPVEAYAQTGERTVLSYLVKPLKEQLMQAFREE